MHLGTAGRRDAAMSSAIRKNSMTHEPPTRRAKPARDIYDCQPLPRNGRVDITVAATESLPRRYLPSPPRRRATGQERDDARAIAKRHFFDCGRDRRADVSLISLYIARPGSRKMTLDERGKD